MQNYDLTISIIKATLCPLCFKPANHHLLVYSGEFFRNVIYYRRYGLDCDILYLRIRVTRDQKQSVKFRRMRGLSLLVRRS